MIAAGNSPSINSVSDFLLFVQSYMSLSVGGRHLRLWLRGQGDHKWQLMPGVYRSSFSLLDEDKRLKTEQHLTQDFRALGAGILSGQESQAELYFIQQHYGMPTRLLDWTTNPLAALWFAVSDDSTIGQDGSISIMDVYQLFETQKATRSGEKLEGISSSRGPVFVEAIKPIFEWNKVSDLPEYIIPVRPDYSRERLGLQRSCFTFHVPNRKALTIQENPTLTTFVVPSIKKAEIKSELSALGIDSFSIFGGLEALSKKLKYSYGLS